MPPLVHDDQMIPPVLHSPAQSGGLNGKMTLTTRLAIAMIMLVAVAVFLVGWLSYRSLEHTLLPRVLERIDTHSRLVASELGSYVGAARGDITALGSSAALSGLMRSHMAGGTDPVDGLSEGTWRERIAGNFAGEVGAKPAYAIMRIVSTDGHEVVRVDRFGRNGTVRITPDAELQVKASRSYYEPTMELSPGELYVSPLNLNRDNSAPLASRSPTLRVAAPLFMPDGKRFGMIMINLDMGPAFNRIRAAVRPGEQIYLVNARGDYLIHPDRTQEFGTLLGTPADWRKDFPYFASTVGGRKQSSRVMRDHDGQPGGVAIAPVVLAGKEWVAIIETVPNQVFMSAAGSIRNTSLVVGIVAVLVAAGLALVISRSLTRPIQQLTAAVEAIGRNDSVPIPVDAGGETGVLARAFARVIGELKAKTAELEREVHQHRLTEAARDHHAAREQQQLEERRSVFETSQDLIMVTDPKGVIVQVSPSADSILGYRPEEMIGRNAIDFIHPDDLEKSRGEFRATRRGQRVQNSDARYVHKSGRAVTLSWMGAWSEPVQRHFFVARDMTESRLAQENLRESEQLARNIIETSLDAFAQIDDSGLILAWNSQAEAIFGWMRAEVLGKDLIDLIVIDDDHDELKAALQRFLRSSQGEILGRRREIMVRRRDGREFKAELSLTALKTRGGFLFNGFFRDLTDKIAAEERIRQSEKMEAIGQLTGGVAHDFNNILTVITGTIEILSDAVAKDPQLAAITKMIDEAAARGADLTQHLLAFARKQPLQPREIDVNTLIVDTAKLLRPTLGEQIEIESVFEHETCLATVDPNQLATALINLALNSRDAMPDGGKLILETGSVYLDESYAAIHDDVRPGRYALIAVSDTGSGIAQVIIDKVFNPFFTSKGPGKGTGLGLSMVYGFIKQSAGHIKIYSEEGHGTTIKMYLPPGTGASLAPEAAFVANVEGGHETILVVEDDGLVRNYVLTQLRSLGYVTLAAANAADALDLVKAGHAFDLLFTDVIMPGTMNGRHLAELLQKERPQLKVLYTSGYTENAIIHHGRLDSGVMLLAKPYRKWDMARMIRRALDS